MRTPLGALPALLLVASVASAALPPSPLIRNAAPRAPRPGVVLVALKPGASLGIAPDGSARAGSSAMGEVLRRFGLTRASSLFRGAARHPRPEYLALRSDAPDFDPYAAAAALRALPGVLAATPDLPMRLHLVPNDPYLSTEWWLGTSTAAVRARPGWDLETGSPSVVIGVLDTGVDTGQPDLAAKIWQNPGEVPGNGIDDDGNGYIDDVNGWDFGNDDADPNPEPLFDEATGIDVGWHGTFVAGLAAASTNDGVGIAGIAWGCRIMPLKVSDTAGELPLSAVAPAIAYAIDNGAGVLNFSLGSPDTLAEPFFQPLVTAAFDGDVVCVSSAGNDGTDERNFPAACESVLAVASTNSQNNRSDFSNWGGWVDIAAPGGGMWSSIARNYPYDEFSLIFFEYLWFYDDIHPYMFGDGTSFSAPIVSGAAALVRSRFPSLTARQVAQQLVLNGDVRAYDNPIGPRLNIQRALSTPLAVVPPDPPGALAFSPPAPNPAAGRVRFAFTLARAARASLSIVDAQGRRVCTLLDGEFGAGPQALAWDGHDGNGRTMPAGLYFAVLRAGQASATRRFAFVR